MFSRRCRNISMKSLYKTRMAFKIRSHIVPDIPGNFKRKYEKKGEERLLCAYCDEGQVMSQSHCLDCSACSELQEGLDLTDISHIVELFRRMLDKRSRMKAEDAQ